MSELTDAIAVLTSFQEKALEVLNAVSDHNTAGDSHEDLRKAILDLKSTDAIYTNAQIESIVESTIQSHTELTLDEAHGGIGAITAAWEAKLASMQAEIDDIKKSMEDSEPDSQTQLSIAIQEIEDAYATPIANLIAQIEAAKAAGNDELAASYQTALDETLSAQNNAIQAVVNSYLSGTL